MLTQYWAPCPLIPSHAHGSICNVHYYSALVLGWPSRFCLIPKTSLVKHLSIPNVFIFYQKMHLMEKIKCYLPRITFSQPVHWFGTSKPISLTSGHFIFFSTKFALSCPLLKLLHLSQHGALSKQTNISSTDYQIKC